MSRITWGAAGTHYFETGIKNCVLYPQNAQGAYPLGVAWDGMASITEKPSGADVTKIYADDEKYLNLRAKEEFGGTIEAYQYPDEFKECNGEAELLTASNMAGVTLGQQSRKTFGLCYRTAIGNDVAGTDYGYKLHLIYGCTCSPSERSYQSINENPEATTMSWEFETVPVPVTGHKSVSCITIDMTKLTAAQKTAVENAVYGKDGEGAAATDPYLPLPDALKTLIESAT